MDSNQTPVGRARAQGEQHLAWPVALAGKPATCCVALRVEVTHDRAGADLTVVSDTPHVGVGKPAETLRALVARGLEDSIRGVVLRELDALGWIDPQCPLTLERLHVTAGRAVHVEVTILPVARNQVAELVELFTSDSDPAVSHGLGLMYAENLEQLWRKASPNGRLPVRYLEDAATQPATVAYMRTPAASAETEVTLAVA